MLAGKMGGTRETFEKTIESWQYVYGLVYMLSPGMSTLSHQLIQILLLSFPTSS